MEEFRREIKGLSMTPSTVFLVSRGKNSSKYGQKAAPPTA